MIAPRWKAAWALAGVPGTFFLFVYCAYQISERTGKLPYYGQGDWIWFSIFGLLLLTGIVSIHTVGKETPQSLLFSGLYGIAMAGLMLFIQLLVACSHGDCI